MTNITEGVNDITSNIDIVSPRDMLKLLNQVDSQMFQGFQLHDSLYSESNLTKLVLLSKQFQLLYKKSSQENIFFAGAGTSGRLSHFCSNSYNKILKTKNFSYLIAGGDKALIKSQELAEDLPKHGEKDFKNNIKEIENLFVGITCGLSAPYVAGILDSNMNKKETKKVILGFNPINLSRTTPMEELEGKSFKDLISGDQSEEFYVINPILGPEAITGSSRMKGGSATKIILDTCFANSLLSEVTTRTVFEMLQQFETTKSFTYINEKKISLLIDQAGRSLKNGGRVFYLGDDNAGVLGFVDASECPPTFGSSFQDIRGFLMNGWASLNNKENDLSHLGEDYNFSFKYFQENILKTLTSKDYVIFLGIQNFGECINTFEEISKELSTNNVPQDWILITDKQSKNNSITEIYIPKLGPLDNFNCFGEFSLKLILNAISTGAHILRGMIYTNKMINMKVSNSKLYERTLKIISSVVNVDMNVAEQSLLKSIHEEYYEEHSKKSVSFHIQSCETKKNIVPIALLIASGKIKSIKEAKEKLEKNPVIRTIFIE
jgi:N-acetylmuramic acid 6-phosphate (MurNAc-6-P) etherase